MAGPPSGTIGNIVSGVFTPVLAILDDSPTIWQSSVSWKGPRAGETDHLRPPARTQRQSVSDLLGHVPVAAAAMRPAPGSPVGSLPGKAPQWAGIANPSASPSRAGGRRQRSRLPRSN